tara:strand:+ start:426 stop:821 length:396 start_codon:yes stop_codon:yes gene_type:complete
MNNKSLYLQTFNKHFLEFIDDVESIFSDNKDILAAKEALIYLKKSNPTILVQVWYEYVCKKYETQINNNDYDFFINKNYDEDLKGSPQIKKILEGIDRVRGLLKDLDDKNKEKTFEYVKNLCTLSNYYNNN